MLPCRNYVSILASAAIALGAAGAQAFEVEEIGSIYVGGQAVTLAGLPEQQLKVPGAEPVKIDPNGDYHTGQMYAQFVRLARPAAKHPLLLWHTGGVTGASWETKPDGSPGWMQFFLRQGHTVYVSDAVERGRATFSRPEIYQSDPIFRDKRDSWEIFRIGPPGSYRTSASERTANPGVKFPIGAFATFQMQMAPRWASTSEATQAAYNALVQKVCPCVIIAHGQAGLFAMRAALVHPAKVMALVAIEPAFAPSPDHHHIERLKSTPHLFVWGDFIATSPIWVEHVKDVKPYHKALVGKGVASTWMDLPAAGIKGNTHAPMMDTNSDVVAAKVQAWMTAKGLMRPNGVAGSAQKPARAAKAKLPGTRPVGGFGVQ
jgi:hypothetical protein